MERKHLASLTEREAASRGVLAVPMKTLPGLDAAADSALVMGSVVVSIDYFKRIAAALRGLIGGRIRSYETVLARGRREALLRMKADAVARGFDAVLCVRLETSRLANALQKGKGTAGVEVLAYGTAIKLPEGSPFRPR